MPERAYIVYKVSKRAPGPEVHKCKEMLAFKQYNSKSESFSMYTRKHLRSKKVSEYDQEIPQSQTADNPVAPRGRAAQPSQVNILVFMGS